MKPSSLPDVYAALLLKTKWWVFAVTIFLTVFFAWHARNVKTINALENMLPEHDPDLARYHELTEMYGGDFIMMIALEADEIFTIPMLTRLDALTREIAKIPAVENVISLTNAPQMTGKDGTIVIEPLMQRVPRSTAELGAFKANVLADSFYTRSLVNAKEPVTAVYIRLRPQSDVAKKQEIRDAFVPRIKALLERHQAILPFKTYLAGNVTLEYELDKSARDNQLITTALMLAMISAILYFLFRRVNGVLLCLATIGLSSLWTTGFVGLLGLPLNFVTALMPPLILVVAVLDCIHIYSLYQAQAPSHTPQEKLRNTIREVLLPCLVTGLTTVIGFGSLITSDMQVIRHFGIFAAFGIVAALFIALAPLPLMLAFLPQSKQPADKVFSPLLARAVRLFTDAAIRSWRRNLVIGAGIVIVGLAGFPRIFIETRPVDFYPRNSTIPREFYFFDAKFNGSTTMDLVLKGAPGAFAEPANLAMVEAFTDNARELPEGSVPISVVDYLKKANQALNGGDPKHFAIPETREAVEQIYLLLSANEHFASLINADYSSMLAHQQVKAVGSRNGKRLMARANALREKHFPAPIESYFSGSNVVWMNMEFYIVKAQITGFSGALTITLLLILLLRSVKWGLISMIPNVFPIIGIFGVMGWFGIPLNMLTTTIASIAIGLAVDDTVHLMIHMRTATARGATIDEAIRTAFALTGPAVVSTSTVLTLGFWALCVTDFIPTRQFGFLGGLTFVFGMVGELMLLPAILKWLGPGLTLTKQAVV